MSRIPLYWFQKEANSRVVHAWENENKQSVMISLPTGGGKTITFAALLKDKLHGSEKRAVILVHRDSLLNQAIGKLNMVWPGVETGKIKGKIREYDRQVTVASVQTLGGRLDEFFESCIRLGRIDYVIVDEAHHTYAPTWKKIVDFFARESSCRILGVTATPLRTNKRESLTDIFQEVVYSVSIFQLIQEGFLSPLVGYSVPTSLSLQGVRKRKGDFVSGDLAGRIRNSDFNAHVVKAWQERARDRKSIVFANDIDHVETLAEMLKGAGARAIGVHGELPIDEQRRILKGFEIGEYNVLVNCNLLTEGYDEPSIDCVLMARPTASRGLYCQMIGRGIRLMPPHKKDCLLIDFTSNSQDNSLVTMQDLLGFYGLKRAEDIYRKDEGEGPVRREISAKTIPTMIAVNTFGEEIRTSPAYSEIDVFDMHKFAWTELEGSYFVTARRNLSITVFKEGDKFTPYLVLSDKPNRFVAKISEQPVDKSSAIAIANIYLYDYGDRKLMSKELAWRSEKPSPEQRERLREALDRHKKFDPQSEIDAGNISETRGAYSDMLTAIYCIGYITGRNVARIPREDAIKMVRNSILSQLRQNKKPTGREGVTPFIEPIIQGPHTSDERESVSNMILFLLNIKHGEFPARFLMENPIAFSNGSVIITPKNYPTYSLTDNQKKYLRDKINAVFRLHLRNKLLILDLDAALSI